MLFHVYKGTAFWSVIVLKIYKNCVYIVLLIGKKVVILRVDFCENRSF